MTDLSPKVVVQTILLIVAAIVLAVVFHDSTYLIGILVALATGGLATQAKPVAGLDLNTSEIKAELPQHVQRR